MVPQKRRWNFAYAWLSYFFAFNGSISFYFNSKSGYLEKSSLLKGYKVFHHLATFLLIIVFVHGRVSLYDKPSKLWIASLWSYGIILIGSLLSCIWCVCRWQNRIFNMFNHLLKMEEQNIIKGYFPSKSQQRHLKLLVYTKLTLNLLMLLFGCFYLNRGVYLIFIVLFLSIFVVPSTENVIFSLMGLISKCCCSLQNGLERILEVEMEMQNQFDQLQWIERMHLRLISLVNVISYVFPYVLLGIIMRTVCCSTISVFFLIRLRFKSSLMLMHFTIDCILGVMDSLVLYAMANTMNCMLQRTRTILRLASEQRSLVQRSIDLLGLHLSYQDTQVNVFGTFIINHQLVFQSATAILLNVISLVQYDLTHEHLFVNKTVDFYYEKRD